MQVMDSNQNGYIDYTEFIAACLQSYNYLKESHLKAAFYYFDRDGSGSISKAELIQCLQSEDFTLQEEVISALMDEVDKDKNGFIDYNEFLTMMKNNSDYSKTVLEKTLE